MNPTLNTQYIKMIDLNRTNFKQITHNTEYIISV